MTHLELAYWPVRSMSMLVLIVGMNALTGNSLINAMNLDPQIYAIAAIGLGLIFVIWFMYKERTSYIP